MLVELHREGSEPPACTAGLFPQNWPTRPFPSSNCDVHIWVKMCRKNKDPIHVIFNRPGVAKLKEETKINKETKVKKETKIKET